MTMLKYLNLFILLLIGFLSKCSSEDTTQWRNQNGGDSVHSEVQFGNKQTMSRSGSSSATNSKAGQTKQVPLLEDYTYIKALDSFYKFHNLSRKWHSAAEVCAQEGANLFYAETEEEADTLSSILRRSHLYIRKKIIFLGINDLDFHNQFVTIDGKSINDVHVRWLHPGPYDYRGRDRNCVKMDQLGFYSRHECDSEEHFVCKKRPVPRTTSVQNSTTITTTATRANIRIATTTYTPNCNIHPNNSVVSLKTFVFWPNGTVPFYINPDHFDNEQAMIILKALAMFALKTCIKFSPVMTAPSEGQHVMTFINPEGIRRCKIETKGHSNYNPHLILLGYDCLKTRELYTIIMRALGLPFEHNRPSRDVYIDVLIENVEPSYIQLFTKNSLIPRALRNIGYDHFSVMHFGERDYSKNGHRTIRFKSRVFSQVREGLTPADIKRIGLTSGDIKKIAMIYGPECRNRDRAEKKAICQTYPRVSRRKREVIEPPANISLRVNPNITPPPHIIAGIAEDANTEKPQEIVAKIYGTNDTM